MRWFARFVVVTWAVACGSSAKQDDGDDTSVGGDDTTDTETPRDPGPPLEAGTPRAAAAEGVLKLPVGTPLSGYTSRCGCLGSTSKQDDRDSHYTTAFIESTGVHIRPTIKALWIENGQNHLVVTKTDTIYSFDGLVKDVTARLEELTGEELDGMVTHTANHNHSSYGTFSQHVGFYLGHDRFNRENYERFVDQVVAVAYEAYEKLEPASIGVGITKDWDPDDKVYSDRRSENNDLIVFDDMGPEQGGKDPHLTVMRVDSAERTTEGGDPAPIAVMFQFGMHPYVFGENISLVTADASALIEMEVAEAFDDPDVVAMFVNGSAGDASVRGDGGDVWARMETVGWRARDAILSLRDDTPTSADAIKIETTSKSVPLGRDEARVHRNNTVDWYYTPFVDDDDYEGDNILYDEDGSLQSPIDDFNTEFGAVFCGTGTFDLPIGTINSEIDQFSGCMRVEFMTTLLQVFFGLSDAEKALPLDGMRQTYVGASFLDGIPVLRADGTTVDKSPFLVGFVPGEALHMYTEMWRHRVRDEFGVEDSMLISYAMDHEGYLMIFEDWMRGEYEADITFWGPIGGEHILEALLYDVVEEDLRTATDEAWEPERGPYVYPDVPLPDNVPDTTPAAGTRITSETAPTCDPSDVERDITKPCYAIPGGEASEGSGIWIPDGFTLDLDIPAEVSRLTPLQLAWFGGDPAVDNPRITVERQQPDASWAPLTSRSGRVISEDFHDFGLGHTPDPLFPADADQSHVYWATWQAVGHIHDRPGLPEGTYRLKVEGKRYDGQSSGYPWSTEPYEVVTEPFEIVPAEVQLGAGDGGVWAWLRVPSANGFRMVDIDGDADGDNPLRGDLTVAWYADEGVRTDTVAAPAPESRRTWLAFPANLTVYGVRVRDAYGNAGVWGDAPPVGEGWDSGLHTGD